MPRKTFKSLVGLFLLLTTATLVVCAFVAVADGKDRSKVPATPVVTQTVPSIKPNDFCATKFLGDSFEWQGHTYVCGGAKPYRWRAAS